MKTKGRTDLFIAGVVFLGGAAFLAGTLGADIGRIDPVVLGLLVLLAAGSQRIPVLLFRNAGISVSFAAATAAYVLYGVGPGVWVNFVAAVVSAFSPKRKPLRKALFNAGNLTFTAFLAGHAYQLVGGAVPPRDIPTALFAGAVAASVHFIVATALVSFIVALTTGTGIVAVWRENYSWTTVNSIAVSLNGVAIALATQAIGPAGVAAFVLPLAAAWWTYRLYVDRSREVRSRNDRLSGQNQVLTQTNERLWSTNVSALSALLVALRASEAHSGDRSAELVRQAFSSLGPVDDHVLDELISALRVGRQLDAATVEKLVARLAEPAFASVPITKS